MRILEVEGRKPGIWVYHVSHVASTQAALFRSLLAKGLQPSSTGYSGPGVYFAYEPSEGYYHVSPEDSVVLRAKWSKLVDLYGVYPAKKNGVQRTDDEIIVPGPVPPNLIEVEYFPDEWWTLEDALAAERGHGVD